MPRKSSGSHNTRYENFRNPEAPPWNLQVEREFWAQVDGEVSAPCWLWMGRLVKAAYGLFDDGYRQVLAHRWIFALYHGPLAPDQRVYHTCAVPFCVNPTHLCASRQVQRAA